MELTKETAKKLYDQQPDWFKKELEDTFGKECFEKIPYNRIKTFADACKACDTTEEEFERSYGNLGLDDDIINYLKLKIITKAINQDWTADWNNTNQRKWYPYFNLSSGFGFSCSGYNCGYTGTTVGSRLCFESEEKANYAGKQFLELYKQFLT